MGIPCPIRNISIDTIMYKFLSLLIYLPLLAACHTAEPPAPWGPVPSPRQLAWQNMEFYAFVHFNMNTFTDKEWGYGDESPALFNPTDLDCRQWARVAKEAGMKGIILTAKHHDGFCLWPSAFTEHSVKNSPWKNGKGDVVKELAEACREYGLKMGIYLSPWDRNSALYGTPEYITYYRNQLRELLTNYGEIFEIWFDGANGGTGYYGGARENRKIDRKTYYDWPNTRKIVRELQPDAVMFSDAGPDIRWVGNEHGFAGETNWSRLNRDEFYPGSPNFRLLNTGQEEGKDWVPAECDVSIRPGWFYHPAQDTMVKSVHRLMEIWFKSVGRNGSLLLNLPVDTTGKVNPHDVQRLQEFRAARDAAFRTDLARGKKVHAGTWRGHDPHFRPANVTDGLDSTYWCTDDTVTSASLTIDLEAEKTVNCILVREFIPLGQRVEKFSVDAWQNGGWHSMAEATTIGNKRILRFPGVKTTRIRLNIEMSKACPVISTVELYQIPEDSAP